MHVVNLYIYTMTIAVYQIGLLAIFAKSCVEVYVTYRSLHFGLNKFEERIFLQIFTVLV